MFEIERPATAFQGTKTKRPRVHDRDHLTFIRGLPCLICGKHGSEAAHVRYGDDRYKKRETGGAEKPDDKWTVPLCAEHHRTGPDAQHNANERDWWASKGIDPLHLALMLFAHSGEDEIGEQIVTKTVNRIER